MDLVGGKGRTNRARLGIPVSKVLMNGLPATRLQGQVLMLISGLWRRSRGTETNVLKLPGLKKKKNPPELLVTLSVFIFIFAFLYFLLSLQRACIICANLNSFFLKPLLVLCSLPIGKVYIYLVYTYKDKCLIPFYTFKVFCFLFSQET